MSGSVTSWLEQMRHGNEQATEKVWNYYSSDLHHHLASSCRDLAICDEEDVATTAFFRLLTAMKDETRYGDLDRVEFWRILLVASKRTSLDWQKYDHAACRGGGFTTIPLDFAEEIADAPGSTTCIEESHLLELAERMCKPEFKRVVQLRQKGLTNMQIANEIGFSLRTVQYMISDLKNAWTAALDAD